MEIRKVACVGGGIIGHSWATLFSSKGLEVAILTRSQETLARAVKKIKDNLNFLEQYGLLKKGEPEAALKRIKTTTSLADAVDGVDFVEESIAESYEIKKKVFKEVDSIAPKHAILASSTSGLTMTEIQRATTKPERCIVAHPLNPPLLIPLVELVPGNRTSADTIELVYGFMKKLGKVPVVLKREVPGFIVNRLQAAVWREAISLVDKGVATVEDVDKALYAGLGIRWAFMGVNLTLHLGGGQGGISYFIKHLEPTFSGIWRDMETWTNISQSKSKKIIEGVEKTSTVIDKTVSQLTKWRDRKLIKILKVLYEPKAESIETYS